MLKRHVFTLIPLLWTITQFSYAEDCLVSTNPPSLIGNYPGIVEEKLDSSNGFYLASLDNGDQLMVHFGQCELALRGHYLIYEEQDRQTKNGKMALFLSHMLPSPGDSESVIKQFEALDDSELNGGVILQGQNAEHKLTIAESRSPLFVNEIHYEWLPPQH